MTEAARQDPRDLAPPGLLVPWDGGQHAGGFHARSLARQAVRREHLILGLDQPLAAQLHRQRDLGGDTHSERDRAAVRDAKSARGFERVAGGVPLVKDPPPAPPPPALAPSPRLRL